MMKILLVLSLGLVSANAFALIQGDTVREFTMTDYNTSVTLSYQYHFNGGTFDAWHIKAIVKNPFVELQNLTAWVEIKSVDCYGQQTWTMAEARRIDATTIEADFGDQVVPMIGGHHGVFRLKTS